MAVAELRADDCERVCFGRHAAVDCDAVSAAADGAFHAVTSVALPEESVWAEMCLFPFGVICAKSRIEFPEQVRVPCD